jgi:hypothetical protein
MKQVITLVILFAAYTASAQKPQTPKAYTVTLSLEQWQQTVRVIDSASKILIESDAPARNVSYVNFNLSQLMQIIQIQVSQQLAAEQKAATDTTKVKTPKKEK